LPPGVDGTVELPPMEEGDDFCDDSDADLDCCDDEMCNEEVVNNDNPGDEVIGSAEGNE
jgi:hypothetical protein